MKPGKNKNKGTGESSEKYHKRISFADFIKRRLIVWQKMARNGGKGFWEAEARLEGTLGS